MKSRNPSNHPNTTRALLSACAAALAVAIALPAAAHADEVTPPPVPDGIEVTTGDVPFLVGHAIGTQNYVCLPSGSGVAFTLFTPEATLFNDNDKQIITHFFRPNPDQQNTNPALQAIGPIRAAWQAGDTSTIWGQVNPGNSSLDARFVAANSVPWVKVTIVGREDGPTGGARIADSTFVQRLNTHGGVAPSTGCSSSADVGHLAFVPYTADYFFYRPPGIGAVHE